MVESVTVHIPLALYERLKQRADQAQRSVEDELLEAAGTAVADDVLPPDLTDTLASLTLLNDPALWDAAKSHLPIETAEQLSILNLKRQSVGLTEAEVLLLDQLLHQYEQMMLVRAQAALLLKQRGHDISMLHCGA